MNVEDFRYVAAHGTATRLGDPIEIHALTHSFRQFTQRRNFCAVGSVKANIGHTTAAAGVMNVIGVLVSLKTVRFHPRFTLTARMSTSNSAIVRSS